MVSTWTSTEHDAGLGALSFLDGTARRTLGRRR
jgi:hypothetical protein